MPHVSDVHPTSHDRHDLMLVAALAAGDLAGTDRDQAIALTRSCGDCAQLRDDLQAIARATATTPPPIPAPSRDFRLTPADARRLRPAMWRRVAAAIGGLRPTTLRPIGVGLATLGLVGVLVGNLQVGDPGQPVTGASHSSEAAASGRPIDVDAAAPGAAAPSAAASAPASSSSDERLGTFDGGAKGSSVPVANLPRTARPVPVPSGEGIPRAAAGGAQTSAAPKTAEQSATDFEAVGQAEPARSLSALQVLSAGVILVGLAVLALGFRRGRRTE